MRRKTAHLNQIQHELKMWSIDKSAALKHEFTIVASISLHFVLIKVTRNANPMFAPYLQVKQTPAVITLYLPSRKYNTNVTFAQRM